MLRSIDAWNRSIMLERLLFKARTMPGVARLASWWHHVRFRWLTGGSGNAAFLSVLIVPVVVLASMVRFAYVDQMTLAAERQRRADLACLAENIYFEARGEPIAGQRAVAEVTLNRVASANFPATVCEVVHEKNWDPIRKRYLGAFSWTEFDWMARPSGTAWERAVDVAVAVYDDEEARLVEGALFYHASHIEPSWARSKNTVATIGRHIFYE